MPKKLRLGFMGTGFPNLRHGEAFQSLPGVELTAVAETDGRRRKEYVQKFGEMQEYGDYHDMLENAELDAAIIALPTDLHAEASLASFDAGLHVLCEKPPTVNTREMLRVAQKARATGLTYMFSRQFRFSSPSLQARKLAGSGRLGELYHAEAKWLRGRYIPTGRWRWRLDRSRGGGVLLDLGIHAIDEAWFIMGCPRPVEVSAGMHSAFAHLAVKGQEYTADDAAVGLIRFENGATLHFTATFSLNWPGPEPPPAGTKSFNPQLRQTAVYGTHGGVSITNSREGVEIMGLKRGVRVRPLRAEETPGANGAHPHFVRQAEDFLRAVRRNTTPTNSAEQAIMLMQVLDALRKSGDTNRAVRISKRA